MNFDKRLLAIADCSVINFQKPTESEEIAGGIVFSPNPVITATDDLVLSHELCHYIAGKDDYNIFATAIIAMDDNPIFKYTLNLLYDWYHENVYKEYSFLLIQNLEKLHKKTKNIKIDEKIKNSPELYYLMNMYMNNIETPEIVGIKSVKDLVFLAMELTPIIAKKISLDKIKKILIMLNKNGVTGAGTSTYGSMPQYSDYYSKAVSKYENSISIIEKLWDKSKYSWSKKHYGEIDWKNLIPTYIGEKVNSPVFLVLNKNIFNKNVYICVDRSSSTKWQLSIDIMDISIILTESLIRNKAKISMIDIGVEDKIINKIDDNINYQWFTPMAENNTPLGEVLLTIKEKSPNSLLLIITDGEPNDWNDLQQAIKQFPGTTLSFIIGKSFDIYATKISNCISITPYNLLEQLANYINSGNLL